MKKLFKIFGWIVGSFVILLIISVAGLWLFFPVDKVKQLAVDKGSQRLGRDISVKEAEISFWGGLGIELIDVIIGNPPELSQGDFLKAENIDIKLRILPLLSGNYHIDKLIINRPLINLVKLKDGSNNYTFKTVEKEMPTPLAEQITPEVKVAAAAVTFDKLEINGGMLSFRDDSSNVTVDLKELELSTTLLNPRTNFYQSSGEIAVESILMKNDISLPSVSLKLVYNVDYDINKKSVTLDDTEFDINNVKFQLRGEVSNIEGEIKIRSNVKSKKISIADLFEFVPREKVKLLDEINVNGDFSLDVDLEYDRSQRDIFTYYGTAIVHSMDMMHKKIPGKFKFKEALIDIKNDNLRMNIKDGYFDNKPLKGHLVINNFKNPTVNGELAGTVNLNYIQPFLSVKHKHEIAGEAEFNIKLYGSVNNFDNMDFSGNLIVRDGSYNSLLLWEGIESFNLDMYFDNKLMNVKQFSAKTSSGSITFQGRLNNLVPYLLVDSLKAIKISPTIDGSLQGKLNMAALNSLLPPKGGPHLDGIFYMQLKLAGSIKDYNRFKPRGSITIKDASYTDSLLPEPIEHFEAEMSITPDTIIVTNMRAKFISSDASFKGKLINPFPYLLPLKNLDRSEMKKPLFLFNLSSTRFNTDKLFPEAVPGSGDSITITSKDSVSTIILPDIDGQGAFEIDTLIYSNIEFTKINGKIKIYDRKIECYDVTGKVYSGDISGKTIIDLNDFNNPKYIGNFKASQVEANDFMSRFTELKDHIFGKVDLNGDYNAVGWERESFLNSLTLTSTSTMQKGKLVTSGVIYSVISNLANNIGQPFAKEQPLRDLKTNITAKDGKVRLDKLKTRLGTMGDVELDGFYTFAGDIKYKGSILLTKEWTEKLLAKKGLLGNIANLLTDKSVERIKLPIAFGGTLEKPSFDIDYSSLAGNVGKNLLEDAGGLLNDLFKKKNKK